MRLFAVLDNGTGVVPSQVFRFNVLLASIRIEPFRFVLQGVQ